MMGAPVDQPEFFHAQLVEKGVEREKLLEMISHVQNVQAAWLLILFCAGVRGRISW